MKKMHFTNKVLALLLVLSLLLLGNGIESVAAFQGSPILETLVMVNAPPPGPHSLIAPGVAQHIIMVRNIGTDTANGVEISAVLPVGFSYRSFSYVRIGAERVEPFTEAPVGSATPYWGTFIIPAGASVSIAMEADVAASIEGGIKHISATATSSTPGTTVIPYDGLDPENTDDDLVVNPPVLDVTKTTSTPEVTAPGQATYTITVTNSGKMTAEDVVITDTLETGFTYAANDPPTLLGGATYDWAVLPSLDDPTPEWGHFTIPYNGTVKLTFTADIATDVLPGVHHNSASASSSVPATVVNSYDGITSSDEDVNIVAPLLRFDKTTSTPDSTAPGLARYTLTVTNEGASTANGVVITDTLPTGFTYAVHDVPVLRGGATRENPLSTVPGADDPQPSWGAFTLPRGASVEIRFTAYIAPDVPNGTYHNVVSGTSTTPDTVIDFYNGNHPDNTGEDVSTITVPGLEITKSTTTSNINAPGEAQYTIEVTNISSMDTAGVIITDVLPFGFTYDSLETLSVGNGASREDPLSTTPSSGDVTPSWGKFDVPVDGWVRITFNVQVAAGVVDGVYHNSVTGTATTANTFVKPYSGNYPYSTAEDVNVTAIPVLDLRKTTATPSRTAGSQVVYTLSVQNVGGATAKGVVITDTLPFGFTYESHEPPVLSGGATYEPVSSPAPGDSLLNWRRFDIPPNGQVTLRFTARIAASTSSGTYTNAVTATSTTAGTEIEEDDDDEITVDVVAAPVLDISKETTTPTVTTPGTAAYTIVAKNSSSTLISSVEIVDTLPPGFSYVTHDPPVFSGGASGSGVTPSLDDTTPTWGSFSMPAGSTVEISFTANVSNGLAPGVYHNDVSATAGTPGVIFNPYDGDAVDNTAEDVIIAGGRLDIHKAADSGEPVPTAPGEARYTITVTNNGISLVEDVVIADVLPPGFTSTGDNELSLSGGATYDWAFRPVPDETSLVWGKFRIPVGGKVTLFVTAAIDADVSAGVYHNSVTAIAGTPGTIVHDYDGYLPANSAEDVVIASAELEVSKEALTPEATAPGTATYLVRVENTGASIARDVVITDTLPVGFTYESHETPTLQGGATRDSVTTPSMGDTNPTWGSFTIPVEGVVEIVFTADIGYDVLTGTYDNSATATTTSPDAVINAYDGTLSGNTADDVLIDVPELDIEKVTNTLTVNRGGTAEYVITVTNIGASMATDVQILDGLPVGFTYASHDPPVLSGTGTTFDGSLVPSVGEVGPKWGNFDIPRDGSVELTFYAAVGADVPGGVYDNGAGAETNITDAVVNIYDGELEENTAEDVVVPGPVLGLTKSTDPPSAAMYEATAPGSVDYVIKLFNTGDTTAENVTITDPLPDGFTYASHSAPEFNGGAAPSGTIEPTPGDAEPTWGSFTVPQDGSVTIRFTAEVGADVLPGIYHNNATADSSTSWVTVVDYDGFDSENDEEDVLINPPELDFTKWVNLGPEQTASPGDVVEYGFTVTNVGDSQANDVVITDQLGQAEYTCTDCDDYFSFVETVSVTTDGGATAEDPLSIESGAGAREVQWGLFTIPMDGSVTVTFTAQIDPLATAGRYSNIVRGTSTTPETRVNVGGGTASTEEDVIILGPEALALKETIPPALYGAPYQATAPGTVQYKINIFNWSIDYSDPAIGIELHDYLPEGFTLVQASAPDCTGGASFGGELIPSAGQRELKWGYFTLPYPDGECEIIITVDIDETVPADLYDNCLGGLTYEEETLTTLWVEECSGEDHYDEDVEIEGPVLDVFKTTDPPNTETEPYYGSSPGTVDYVITVTNNGGTTAHGVRIIDTLPAGFGYTSHDPPVLEGDATYASALSPAPGDPEPKWGDFTIPPDGSVELTFKANVSSGLPVGVYHSDTTVTSTSPNATINPYEGTDEESTLEDVIIKPYVVVEKSTTTPEPTAPGLAEYVITVTNAKGVTTSGLTIKDVLPEGFTFASQTRMLLLNGAINDGSVAPLPGGREPEWGSFTLPVGAQVKITFKANIDDDVLAGVYHNSVEGISTDPDAIVENYDGDAVFNTEEDVTILPTQLDITKRTDIPFTASPGTTTYVITITNNGGSRADDVIVTDMLAAGFTSGSLNVLDLTGLATYDWSITPSAGASIPQWGNFSIPPGDTVTITFDADVGLGVPDGTYHNSVDATSVTAGTVVNGYDGTDLANDAEDVTVSNDPVLSLTKSTNTPVLSAGDTAVYTIRATNIGGSEAAGVVITDTLPDHFTYDSHDAPMLNGATYDGSQAPALGDTMPAWGNFTIPVGGSVTLTFYAAIDAAAPNGLYHNSVDATSTTPAAIIIAYDGTDPARTAENVNVGADPVLDITKRTNTPNRQAGQTANYTITVTNNGWADAENVVIRDILPSGFTYTGQSTPVFPAAVTYDASVQPGEGDTTPEWGNFTIPPGASVTITFDADIAGTVGDGTYHNSATATTTTSGTIINSYEGSAPANGADDVNVADNPVLDITKTTSTGTLQAGQMATYTISLVNNSGSEAAGVQITDTLPGGFSFESGDPPALGTGVTYDSTTQPASGDTTLQWSSFTIPAGSDVTITFRATVATGVTPGTYTNFVTASTTTPGTVVHDGSVNVVIVEPGSDPVLSFTKTTETPSLQPGDTATYTIQLTNTGGSEAAGVVITDTLPANFTFAAEQLLDISSGVTHDGTITPSAGSTEPAWGNFTIPVGESVTITFTASVGGSVPDGTYTNTVSGTSTTPNTTVSDGSVAVTVGTPPGNPVLSFTKSASPSFVQAGDTVTFTLSLNNTGGSEAVGVVITDTLPAGFTYGSQVSLNTSTSVTHDGAVTPSAGSSTPAWGNFTIPAGGSVTISFNASVGGSVTDGTYTNTVTATSTTPDVTVNDGSTNVVVGSVSGNPVLTFTKSAGELFYQPGDTVTYTIKVVNTGGVTAAGVVITDTLPAGFAYAGHSDPVLNGASYDGTVTPSGGTPQWGNFTIPPGVQVTLTFTANIATSVTPDTYTNSVTGTSTTPDTAVTGGSVDVVIGQPELPGQAVLVSPSGDIADNTPAYTWQAATLTVGYRLWVEGASGVLIDEWYQAADVCEGGTCTITPPNMLAAGSYIWKVQTWNDAGYGPWSETLDFFNTRPPTPPAAATLMSPSGTIGISTPTYSWQQVNFATAYRLWTSSGIDEWYQAADVCNTGVCMVTPGAALADGNYTWNIQTWNQAGEGPWADQMTFFVYTGTATVPGQPVAVSPSGDIADSTPTYTWQAASDADRYHLWVNGPSSMVVDVWYDATAVCSAGTCSATPGTELASENYTWRVVGTNANGEGPWSAAMDFFYVGESAVPGEVVLISPSGDLDSGLVTFTWEEAEFAIMYRLWVSGPSGVIHDQRYRAPAICDTGVCSVTLSAPLPCGAYTWRVQPISNITFGPWSDPLGFTVSEPSLDAPVLSSPNGDISTNDPAYSWQETSGADRYHLWVVGPSGTVVDAWYEADAVCSAGTCSATPGVVLAAGEYTWRAQARKGDVEGPWSSAMAFSPLYPDAATLVSPDGDITTDKPAYSWQAVGSATGYRLRVSKASGAVIDVWYEAGDVCSAGTCSVTPETALGGGAYTWKVQTANDLGAGPWSGSLTFFYDAGLVDLPGRPVLLDPSGTIATESPTFSWQVVPGATGYLLWVEGESSVILEKSYRASNICSGDTCSVTPGLVLAVGSYTWRVQGFNNFGYGPWSDEMGFAYEGGPVSPQLPGVAVPVAPSGTITTDNPTYTWQAATDAEQYHLSVSGPSGVVVDAWYGVDAVCSAGTCSVTTGTQLAAGDHSWRVQARNGEGDGPWSSTMSFSYEAGSPMLPGAVTLVSPTGSISSSAPAFSWQVVEHATGYRLWVSGPSGEVLNKTYQSVNICANSTCTVSPGLSLGAGSYSWRVQGFNNFGYGPWSTTMNFEVTVQEPAPQPTSTPTDTPTSTPTSTPQPTSTPASNIPPE